MLIFHILTTYFINLLLRITQLSKLIYWILKMEVLDSTTGSKKQNTRAQLWSGCLQVAERRQVDPTITFLVQELSILIDYFRIFVYTNSMQPVFYLQLVFLKRNYRAWFNLQASLQICDSVALNRIRRLFCYAVTCSVSVLHVITNINRHYFYLHTHTYLNNQLQYSGPTDK